MDAPEFVRIYPYLSELTYASDPELRFSHAARFKDGHWWIGGTIVQIHTHLERELFFVGAISERREHDFPARRFPTLEAALVYLKLAAT